MSATEQNWYPWQGRVVRIFDEVMVVKCRFSGQVRYRWFGNDFTVVVGDPDEVDVGDIIRFHTCAGEQAQYQELMSR